MDDTVSILESSSLHDVYDTFITHQKALLKYSIKCIMDLGITFYTTSGEEVCLWSDCIFLMDNTNPVDSVLEKYLERDDLCPDVSEYVIRNYLITDCCLAVEVNKNGEMML